MGVAGYRCWVFGDLCARSRYGHGTSAAPVLCADYPRGLPFRHARRPDAALAAVVLYHFANRSQFTRPYQESDIIQIALFLAVGVVTAKLVNDARRLHVLSMTDDLTGLHNLRSFEVRLLSIVRASRQANGAFSLLVLDVDCLKDLNDQHGHLAGAEAVRTVGQYHRWAPSTGQSCLPLRW